MFNFLFQGKVGEMMAPIKSPEAQLLIAIQNKQQDKIRELLEAQGVGANFANDRGVRPMHMACHSGDMALVQRLLELGADIVTADNSGNTPLHYASKAGHTELAKMLVGQGGAVEKRNAMRLTAYDVATDHVIRQFLLPLQLKAEAGNADYAVHSMGITSDAPRNYEQYGVPGIGNQSHALHGQPYGQSNHPSSVGPDPMNAALGALMQAPTMGPPRPGAAPPGAYPGGFAGSPPGPIDCAVRPAALPTPLAMGSPPPAVPPRPGAPLPTPGPSAASPPLPPASFPGADTGAAGGAASPPAFPPPPQAFSGPATVNAEGGSAASPPADAAPQPTAESTTMESTTTGPPPSPPAVSGASLAGVGVQIQPPLPPRAVGSPAASPVGAGGAGSPSAEGGPAGAELFPAEDDGGEPRPGAPVNVHQGGGDIATEPLRPGAVAPTGVAQFGGAPVMTSIDLSSRFKAQVAVAGPKDSFNGSGIGGPTPPPPAHPSSAPSSGQGRTAPPPSRPPGAYTPGPGPHQPAGEKPGKFKPIKADGFHSSASDKELQRRYGHTTILRDMGAPPTAAQLGAPPMASPPMAGPPMAGPPMARPSNNGGYAPPGAGFGGNLYGMPPAGYYGQPFGGGGGVQLGGTQPSVGQQPLGQQPPLPPPPPAAGHQQVAHAYPAPSANPNPLPMPGAHGYGGARQPAAFGASSGGGDGGGGFSVFNPATDRVIAADSNSSAVL